MVPETRYTRVDGAHVAYQVSGSGPPDLVYMGLYGSHQDLQWEEPRFAHFLRRLQSLGRLVTFDRRGTGLSDRGGAPTLEERARDIEAVLDAVGVERAALFAAGGAGQQAMLFAATRPHRCTALVLFASAARILEVDGYPIGYPPELLEQLVEASDQVYGTGVAVTMFGRSLLDDERFTQWASRYERAIASRSEARAMLQLHFESDVRPLLATISVPTLVMYRRGSEQPIGRWSEYLAEHIPGAQLVVLDGEDQWPFAGDADALVNEIERFLPDVAPVDHTVRALTTVLFTDIVDSTAQATATGDRRWRTLLETHDDVVRTEITRHGGRAVKQTGDGFLATFDGPARAVQCALAIRDALLAVSLRTRAGLHTGEIELRGDDVSGIAVHIAARVAALAAAGEVLTTTTVRDLVVGSGIRFDDRGEHELKGLPDPVRVLSASSATL